MTNYSPFPKRRDSKWSSECTTKSKSVSWRNNHSRSLFTWKFEKRPRMIVFWFWFGFRFAFLWRFRVSSFVTWLLEIWHDSFICMIWIFYITSHRAASFPGTKRICGNPSLFTGISMIFSVIPGNPSEMECWYQEKKFVAWRMLGNDQLGKNSWETRG